MVEIKVSAYPLPDGPVGYVIKMYQDQSSHTLYLHYTDDSVRWLHLPMYYHLKATAEKCLSNYVRSLITGEISNGIRQTNPQSI